MSNHAYLLIGGILGLYGMITGVRGSYRASKNERQRHICVGAGVFFTALSTAILVLAW